MDSVKELANKVNRLEGKLKKSQEQTRKLREQLKTVRKSRGNWKAKSQSNWLKIKSLSKPLCRTGQHVARHRYDLWLMCFCVSLRLFAGCSYRSIAKILTLSYLSLQLEKGGRPCANTVENWVKKLGYYQQEIRGTEGLSGDLCLIMDESMCVGPYRQLLILAAEANKTNDQALDMKQVRVVHSSVAKVYNGEEIAGFIADIQAKSSQTIRYAVCDNGSTLKKACRLSQLPQVSDVGHAMGRCLEKAFKKEEGYQNWSKAVSQWTYKGVNRTYAFLLPPKQRTIARFMNIGPVVEWGMEVLNRFEKLPQEARLAFADLPDHQPILMELDAALDLANAVAALLKTDGLCHENVEKCREMADEPVGKTTPERFKTALLEYLDQLDELVKNTKKRWNASSDVIESMFGKRKAKDAGHPYVQSGIQVLEMPLFAWSEQDVHDKLQQALEAVSIRQTKQWIDTQFVENQTVSRKKFFEKEG